MPNRGVLIHNEHFVEEGINGWPGTRDDLEKREAFAAGKVSPRAIKDAEILPIELSFWPLPKIGLC